MLVLGYRQLKTGSQFLKVVERIISVSGSLLYDERLQMEPRAQLIQVYRILTEIAYIHVFVTEAALLKHRLS